MSAMTPEFENTLLLATLEKEIELHEVTKQALANALEEVESIKVRVIELEGDLEDAHYDAIERGERE